MRKNKGKIQTRIIAITVTCLSIMCLIVSLVSYFVFNSYLKESLYQSSEASLELLSDSINSNISGINRFIRFIQTNSNVSEYIEASPEPDSVLTVATYDRLSEEYSNNPANAYMPRVVVVSGSHFMQIVNATYSQDIDLAVEIPKLDFFNESLESEAITFNTGIIKDPFYKRGIDILPVIRPITYKFSSKTGGFIFLEIPATLFTDAFNRYELMEDSYLFLTVEDHNYIYEKGTLTETYELPDEIVSKDLSFPGITISQSISSAQFKEEAKLMYFVLIGIILGILLVGLVMMYILNHMISEPVLKLQKKMKRVSDGHFERDPLIEWDSELGDIGRGINDLAESVNLYMEKKVEDEKQKRDLEYKVLQSQINPHFIYNTLNSIKWMATVQGAEGISEMTTALAKLLKSISKGTSTLVPIEEEISLLKDYFTIQSYRYGGTITLTCDFDNIDISKYSIIKFTLQPIVENAVFHGLEPKGNGNVLVKADYEEKGIVIMVHDDGVGMSKDKVDKLLTEDRPGKSDFFKELGVMNVHKRLQYEFGEEYGLEIESVENEYTNIYIHIPAKEV